MKRQLNVSMLAALFCATTALAQNAPATKAASKASGDYSSDIATVLDSQGQALVQAKEAAGNTEDETVRAALTTAIKAMEKAQTALTAAKDSPDKLGPALTAEQQAYQALLKATPREYRISRSRNGQPSGGQNSGQPNQRQLDQLDMKAEANRYETERQASAAPTQQQREQSAAADRLKELAQRQQDLNERLRELQTALQAAKNDQEREDIQRQLKRLRDEERQMLADVDQLRQKMEESPNASANAEARQQLDQTRSDVQRAAQEMERNSPSQALAAGTRAQQSMQTLREDLRKQTSSQFSEQMRQMRNEARDLANQEDDIAKKLDTLQNGERKLDNSADTKALSEQLAKQESSLTNLLSTMRAVSEQSENSEPLLAQKLYDTLRRAEQKRTDNLLDVGSQLAQRGFLPQTSEVERSARTNINELRQGVESAAESVLGNETDALRYAQKELEDLTRQMEREIVGGTNGTQRGGAQAGTGGQSNQLASAAGSRPGQNGANGDGTNRTASASNGQPGTNESQQAQNSGQRGQPGQSGQPGQQASRDGQGAAQNGNPGQRAGNSPSGQNGGRGQPGQNGQGTNQGPSEAQNQSGDNPGQQANNNPGGQPNGGQRPGGQPGQGGQQAQNGQQGQAGQGGQGGQGGGAGTSRERLTQLARQLNNTGGQTGGNAAGGGQNGGPLTGGDYVNWSDRMRDVQQALDPADLRSQLATVRERASALRAQYRQTGRAPDTNVVREQLLVPMTQVRVWLQEEIARQQNANSLVPLDRDPVPASYSELVRKYYEKLGSAQ